MIRTTCYSFYTRTVQTFSEKPKNSLLTASVLIATAATIQTINPKTLLAKVATIGTVSVLATLLIDRVCSPPVKEAKVQSEKVEESHNELAEAFYLLAKLYDERNQNQNNENNNNTKHDHIVELIRILKNNDLNAIKDLHISITRK